MIFTGGFDTGKQGKEWPGDFEIIRHDPPRTWDAVRAVENPATSAPWIRIHLRGRRPLGRRSRLRFDYMLSRGTLRVELADTKTDQTHALAMSDLIVGSWATASLDFKVPGGAQADEIRFLAEKGAKLLVDDVLLYEPGE